MDLLPIGSDELLYIQAERANVIIKSIGRHSSFSNTIHDKPEAVLKVVSEDCVKVAVWDGTDSLFYDNPEMNIVNCMVHPMFFEQQRYEIIIEADSNQDIVSFWHDNINIRNKITRASRKHNLLSGVINFGNEIGFSDFIIKINGNEYIRIVIEVYPSKLSYKADYQAILADVTAEIYNLVFDFLKKTYHGYGQGDKVESSPVEFLAVIRKIYQDFIRAVDKIIGQPHHILNNCYEVLPEHKVARVDKRGYRWLEKHPDHVMRAESRIMADRALAARKQVTYNTKENCMVKYILQMIAKKLDMFRTNYLRMQRNKDENILNEIDNMIFSIKRHMRTSFLKEIDAKEVNMGMSLVFSMAPGYRNLYKHYLMLMRGLSISGGIFDISLKDMALLYEYWCFIKLNSILRDRYELISQDIIKIKENGLFISLVKGQGSQVKYRNMDNGDVIKLSYNPRIENSPTITQRPDNVLSLKKYNGLGREQQYEYVFDAKYRINPALPGTDYYNLISCDPGPEVDDINTMHRYRDAIVYQKEAISFERTMFGAYVLFPYADLERYKKHKFYKSIEEVNIGGIPFLPSATGMVVEILEELIADSQESAFERTILPRGIEEKLARVNWKYRDVLVGSLKSKAQLKVNLQHKFYHIPASKLPENMLPIHYVAIYQSRNFFQEEAGIRYYGVVTKCIPVRRNQITEIPSNSIEDYYRIEVEAWKQLPQVVAPGEFGQVRCFTNLFLLEHSVEYPEILLKSEEEFRLYSELKRAVKNTEIDGEGNEMGFRIGNLLILFESKEIHIYHEHRLIAKYDSNEFVRKPNVIFRRIRKMLV